MLEHVKIEPGKLRPRDGRYELRVTEPMEETAYVDRLELLAIDHPQRQEVFPDEYLAVSGPSPSHRLLVAQAAFFPARATGPESQDCTERLLHADRTYAYQPPPPDVEPPPGRVLDTCQHWLPDGTLCPHFPVPGSRPIRCYRHVHHILALCAIACHITGGTRRRTG